MTQRLRRIVPVALLLLGLAMALCGPSFADAEKITVQDAHAQAASGEIVLIDVRTPGEWRDTGVGEGAHTVSMHLPGFAEKLAAIIGGDMSKTVALICARGGRSARMSAQLARMGYTKILDVAEGMLGSGHGPGWLGTRLPTVPFTD